MTLPELTEILSPPEAPVETGSPEEWSLVEEEIGTPLPADYKEYVATYGTGSIADFLWPYNPFSENRHLNLVWRVELHAGALRQIREEFGEEEVPYPPYPESGGLMSWAVSDNGDTLYWLMQGDPDHWRVVVNESRGPDFERFGESTTSFLAKLISGELNSEILPSSVFEGHVAFRPIERSDV